MEQVHIIRHRHYVKQTPLCVSRPQGCLLNRFWPLLRACWKSPSRLHGTSPELRSPRDRGARAVSFCPTDATREAAQALDMRSAAAVGQQLQWLQTRLSADPRMRRCLSGFE